MSEMAQDPTRAGSEPPDWAGEVPGQIAGLARDLIETHFTRPGLAQMPWLEGSFRSLDPA